MSWTQPKTWSSEPLTAADLNTHVRDNLSILKTPGSASYIISETTDLTLSSTSFADVDATEGKFQHTITTQGGDVMVGVHFSYGGASGTVLYLDVAVDGTRVGGDDGIIGAAGIGAGSAVDGFVGFFRIITGLSAGSHVFKLQYKRLTNNFTLYRGQATTDGKTKGQFWVREIS